MPSACASDCNMTQSSTHGRPVGLSVGFALGSLRPGHMASSSDYAAMPYLGHAPMRRDCSWPNPPILLSRFQMLPRRSSSVAQAASSLFTAVADGPPAASIGVPASSSTLKKFWSGAGTPTLPLPQDASPPPPPPPATPPLT